MSDNKQIKYVKSVTTSRITPTIDIEVDSDLHAFKAKHPTSGAVGISHNSAMISLSNLSDDRMRHAKSGAWWETQGHRALANNSACYTERPDVGIFMQEWQSLYESKSGERGIFNRQAAKNIAKLNGRRSIDFDFGTNPCCVTGGVEVDVISDGVEQRMKLSDVVAYVGTGLPLAVKSYDGVNVIHKSITWAGMTRKDAKLVKVSESSSGKTVICTPDHPVFTGARGYIEAAKLESGDTLLIDGTLTNGHVIVEELDYTEDTYDITVEDTHCFFANDILVHNSEIILRPYQFCNLTEIIVRASDTMEDISRKARIATIMGTFQSTLTHFPYLRKIWKDNTDQERLLGVSMTGVLDNALLNNPYDSELQSRLESIKHLAVATNAEFAEILQIPASAAITCNKPSGTVSQLTNTASGIHPRHSKYYFRRVRNDIKDPLTAAMIAAGVPNEPDVMKPDSTVVFTFPKKAPDGAVLRSDLDAISHLRLWLAYQRFYCEHKPSVTISVMEKEWPAVGAFVWEHFDEMSGVSFLPYDGGSYKQAPYEECTEAEYEAMLAIMPTSIDWDAIVETEDNVEGAQMLACTAPGGCEI